MTNRELNSRLVKNYDNTLIHRTLKSAQTSHRDFYKGMDYLKGIFGERVKRSALIFDGESELHTQQNGVYNFRNFDWKQIN
ncbi:hypothetical protein AGMMS4956_14100 [Bacteroidia bacterium]|nr:hypothetical protein AGMMS4956_14100 [Bacteroidia bacterium]